MIQIIHCQGMLTNYGTFHFPREREIESNKNEIERQKMISFCALIVESKDDMSHLAYKEYEQEWEN